MGSTSYLSCSLAVLCDDVKCPMYYGKFAVDDQSLLTSIESAGFRSICGSCKHTESECVKLYSVSAYDRPKMNMQDFYNYRSRLQKLEFALR